MVVATSSKRCRPSKASIRRANSACASAIMRAGTSSRPTSSNSSAMRLLRNHPRVSLGNADGEDANTGNDADPLGHGNCAPGVQQIEEMRALEAEIVGRQNRKTAPLRRVKILRQLRGPAQQLLALRFVEAQVFPQLLHIGLLEVVDRELHLLEMPDLAVGDRVRGTRPNHVVDRVDVLQKGGDT